MTVLDALQRAPLFKDFSPTGLEVLAEIAQERKLAAGETLFSEDSPGDSLFVIGSGTVRLVHRHEGGERELGTLGPGEHLGDLGLLARTIRLVTAKAVTDCELLELTRRAFFKKAQDKPVTCLKLAAVVAGEVARRVEASRAALHELAGR
ncbi:MAG TPA: cyclic nucleotide-binding domain-containing protein [Anaeromyxobacteraceae bacterium]|nr:cyclic nucleotide-binding domain-containing protein [Anaeromyxobacteraceae bacterium]